MGDEGVLLLLGWSDRKAPLLAYVVLELDGVPTGVRFRTPTAERGRTRRGAMCTWCQDVRTTEAVLVAARRGGASGKAGNTVGTQVCEQFVCSAHARWTPPRRDPDPATVAADLIGVAERVAGLRERSAAFVRLVAATASGVAWTSKHPARRLLGRPRIQRRRTPS